MLADVCAVALVAFALFLLAGHVFRVVEFVGLDHSNLASPQTVLCFLLLSFGTSKNGPNGRGVGVSDLTT
jgi:hypothetical protein